MIIHWVIYDEHGRVPIIQVQVLLVLRLNFLVKSIEVVDALGKLFHLVLVGNQVEDVVKVLVAQGGERLELITDVLFDLVQGLAQRGYVIDDALLEEYDGVQAGVDGELLVIFQNGFLDLHLVDGDLDLLVIVEAADQFNVLVVGDCLHRRDDDHIMICVLKPFFDGGHHNFSVSVLSASEADGGDLWDF